MKYTGLDEASLVDDAPTRERVANTILEHGPSTAADLAQELHLTPAAIRRHLDQLLADGVLMTREQRVVGQRGRGRPAKVYVITDSGRDHFKHSYDELAAGAIALSQGDRGRRRRHGVRPSPVDRERRALPTAAGQSRSLRTASQVLAKALSEDGYAASVGSTPAGTQMCQNHCPVAHVAEEFPQMCEAETEMFARLLGTHVQRLATIAHGDGVCTTHLPHTTAERLPS